MNMWVNNVHGLKIKAPSEPGKTNHELIVPSMLPKFNRCSNDNGTLIIKNTATLAMISLVPALETAH
jgi:hypothetical protein